MPKYRKKPVVIDAIKWDGKNQDEVSAFTDNKCIFVHSGDCTISIPTLEGIMLAKDGDYIIRGVEGEFYPCRADIFEKTYEKVDKN